MTAADLREEIAVNELLAIQQDITGRAPTVREKTAAAVFLAQFYTGIENILKRISYYRGVPLPVGDAWPIELFQRFCAPAHPQLPALFDQQLAATLSPYRRFRHVAVHGYGFQLDWTRMAEGVSRVDDLFAAVKSTLTHHLQSLDL